MSARRAILFISCFASTSYKSSAFRSTLLTMAHAEDSWETPDAWKALEKLPGATATLGAGCYWGTEKFYAKNFAKKYPGSILGAAVGFMAPGAAKANPSYQEVCSGTTGHVEVVQIKFDETKASYEDVIRFFYEFHDPTTLNRQENDAGTQYSSVIYTYGPEQADIARKVTKEVQDLLTAGQRLGYKNHEVHTAVIPATTFYPAHAEHQRYLEANPNGYCNHRIRFTWEALKKS